MLTGGQADFGEQHCLNMQKIIRIYCECEGRIEKSVPRITGWHHEACRVMTNGNPEGRIFLSFPHMNNGFFLAHHCLYLLIYFKTSSQKSLNMLNTLRCNFTFNITMPSRVRQHGLDKKFYPRIKSKISVSSVQETCI